jgi:glutathione S-transferase
VEGIAQWWLPGDAFSLADLAGALQAMELAGVIEATRAADGQVRYRRTAPDPRNDAQLDRFITGS